MSGFMTVTQWARCTGGLADILRRGAWYAVLGALDADGVLLDVRGHRVRFRRTDLTIRKGPPTHWSVVVRTGVLRPTMGGERGRELVTSYAVCPACANRQDLPERPRRPAAITCAGCARESEVDWGETC
jgi:hypothetical protein